VVPRSRPRDRPPRREHSLLPHRHRLAPAEKEQFGEAQYDAWQTIQRAHAIANGVYVAAPNRVGWENGDIRGNRVEGPGLQFWGGSFIADPFGRIIAKAPHDREDILIAEIDPAAIEEQRRNWPFLRDRRIDAYPPIASRFIDSSPAAVPLRREAK
jgi:N-carbamoylputrescine amidase